MQKFKVSIRTSWFYRLGSRIKITVILKNISHRDYYILPRSTAFDTIPSDCFTLTCNGEKMEYDSIQVKWGEVTEKHFVLLRAKEKLKITISLAEHYLFDRAGKAVLQYQQELVYTPYIDGFNQFLRVEKLNPVCKKFRIFRGKEICATLGVQAQRKEMEMMRAQAAQDDLLDDTEFPQPRVTFCQDEHPNENELEFTAMVKESHFEMIHYLRHSIDELEKEKGQDNRHYEMIFGKRVSSDDPPIEYKKMVLQNLKKILAELHNAQSYKRNDNISIDDCYAYVIGKSNIVYLCGLYMRSLLSGTNSRLGVLLHELSHLYANTKDVKIDEITYYGRTKCRELAKDHPEFAITNADSYEFFVETRFTNWMEEKEWTGCDDIDKTTGGGPAVTMPGAKLELFYKNQDGSLKTSVYDGASYSAPVELKDTQDRVIQAECQPEAIQYKDHLYVFYIPKGERCLHYTVRAGDKWSKGTPVVFPTGVKEETKPVEPFTTPQPVIYHGNLILVYRKKEEATLFMTSWDGISPWKKETDVPDSTALIKDIRYNPGSVVFGGKLFLFYVCRDNLRINYAEYNEEMKTWKMDQTILVKGKPGESSALYAEADSMIRAYVIGEVLQLVFSDKDGNLRQMQVNHSLNKSRLELVFNDYEPLYESTTGEYHPMALPHSLCSFACDGKYGYTVYAGFEGKIYASLRMPVSESV